MPEGHKTHFLARRHDRLLAGECLKITSPQGRFRGEARKITGSMLDAVEAVGKHLFYRFDSGRILHIHLGRYGKFREHPAPPPRPVGQVRVRLVGDAAALDLTGPTTCRVIVPEEQREIVSRLGPDPLGGGRPRAAWDKISVSRKPIGALLLDQTVIAGVGNIFRAEVLFEIEMDPRTAGCDLSRESFDRIWRSTAKMMKTGLRYGRIISVTPAEVGRPLAKVDGKDRFRVYGKDECPRCDGPISTIELASRKLYLCEHCQCG